MGEWEDSKQKICPNNKEFKISNTKEPREKSALHKCPPKASATFCSPLGSQFILFPEEFLPPGCFKVPTATNQDKKANC